MKAKYYVWIFVVLIVVVAAAVYLLTQKEGTSSDQCVVRDDDPDGYLFKICNYIKDNKLDVSRIDPAEYNIKNIEEGEYDGKDAYIVYLDCCYMGDVAYIDKETGEVVGFSLGDK